MCWCDDFSRNDVTDLNIKRVEIVVISGYVCVSVCHLTVVVLFKVISVWKVFLHLSQSEHKSTISTLGRRD